MSNTKQISGENLCDHASDFCSKFRTEEVVKNWKISDSKCITEISMRLLQSVSETAIPHETPTHYLSVSLDKKQKFHLENECK